MIEAANACHQKIATRMKKIYYPLIMKNKVVEEILEPMWNEERKEDGRCFVIFSGMKQSLEQES